MKKMNNKPKLATQYILLAVLMSVSGCLPNDQTMGQKTGTPPGFDQILPTITSTSPTDIVQVSTVEPLYNFKQQCVQIKQTELPTLSGQLVLHSNKQGEHSRSYLLDLKTQTQVSLGNVGYEAVSPDGSKLAYWDIDLKSVIVMDAEGNKLNTIYDPNELLSPVRWLDNQ